MTTTAITPSETAEVLASMFTENTGRHMLDSGGAYGRNWERAQGKTAADFLAEPSGSIDEYGCISLSTFQFLAERVEFDAELQAEFDEFAENECPGEGWLSVMEQFAEAHTDWSWQTVNTYNHESALDQTLQFLQVDTEGGDWIYGDVVILQVHGGCDVRGGYTAPKLFRLCGWNEVGLCDDTDLYIGCNGSTVTPPQTETLDGFEDTPPYRVSHSWRSMDAGYNWEGDEGWGGDRVATPDYSMSHRSDDPELEYTDDGHAICPVEGCTGTLSVYGMYG